jgi:hypothetical protein
MSKTSVTSKTSKMSNDLGFVVGGNVVQELGFNL